MAKGGIHGDGGWGACMVKGGMCGEGGMHDERGACVVCTHPLYEIRPVNVRAVHILLECILVIN